MPIKPQIAIVGRPKFTANYERFLLENGFAPLVTLNPGEVSACQGLILPGGGDITPGFFGQQNKGSLNIDTELDILQFQAFDLCLKNSLPVLGICKGMQLINIALGGTIIQNMPNTSLHLASHGDLYHDTNIVQGSFLSELYGECALVNSAHHQCIQTLGKNLKEIQHSTIDNCPEAICHDSLPILGLQWHPERLDASLTSLDGVLILSLFSSQSNP